VNAAALVVGHELRTADGGTAVVAAVHNHTGAKDMRDLTVEQVHTYYVVAGNVPVLVHNCGPDLDAMSAAGKGPNKNGLTDAGRAYQKHMDRGELPRVGGADLNSSGQNLLDDILTDPYSDFQPVTQGGFKGGTRVISNRIINNQFVGAVYDANGTFRYFGLFS